MNAQLSSEDLRRIEDRARFLRAQAVHKSLTAFFGGARAAVMSLFGRSVSAA